MQRRRLQEASTSEIGHQPSRSRATGLAHLVRRTLGPIRVRATLVAVIMLAGALGLGSEGLLELLRSRLLHSREEIAVARARDLASQALSGELRSPISVLDEGSAVAQLLDGDSAVVAASSNVSSTVALAGFAPVMGRPTARTFEHLGSGPPGRYRVVALAVEPGDRAKTVYVGVELRTVDHAIDLLSVALAGGLPILVLAGGLAIWIAVGRALRPVERLRREVAAISRSNLHGRVSAPKTGDEIDRLAVTMNSMLERLEIAAATERRFIADASHELRSPLAAIRAQVETARDYPNSVDWTEVANDVLADQDRVECLVRDLLLLARLDSGEVAPIREPLSLRRVVDEELRRRPIPGRVTFTATLEANGEMGGDPAQLARAVRNLLDNAERHASATVTVTLVEAGGQHVLRVIDDGLGIAPADRERVFERFTRLDDARVADVGGTGLGLAIVADIVGAHGGTISVVDSQQGACFEARFPTAAA